ncbi:MAG: DsbA family protein [Solirubrobacteraceae bacterium]
MSRNLTIAGALVALFLILVAVVAIAGGSADDESPAQRTAATTTTATGSTPARVITPDPRRLGEAGSTGVTFTEFLDFECEACRAAFPAIEELRRKYAGRVTFNIRYFPIPSHQNSRNAAVAVEAAFQQGRLEQMYVRMFETQEEWGEQSDSKAGLFREFADDLGLDLKRYDAAVADPKTLQRVERDFAAGATLGVRGTPTFFIGEERVDAQSIDDLRNAIDEAVRGT